MQIANDIMKVVERKEEYKKNLNRCLNVLICPQCGKKLGREGIGGGTLMEGKYTCAVCPFTHTRLE